MAEAAVITLAAAREARAEQQTEQAARAARQAELASSYRPGTPASPAFAPKPAFPALPWQPDGEGVWTCQDPRTGMGFRLVATRSGWGGRVCRPNGTSFLVNWAPCSQGLEAAQSWAAGWLDTAAATADLPPAVPAPVVTQPKVRPAPPAPSPSTVKPAVKPQARQAARAQPAPIEQFLAAPHPGTPPNDWEVKFLRDIYGRGRSPSPKQRAILERIERKTLADLPRLGDYN